MQINIKHSAKVILRARLSACFLVIGFYGSATAASPISILGVHAGMNVRQASKVLETRGLYCDQKPYGVECAIDDAKVTLWGTTDDRGKFTYGHRLTFNCHVTKTCELSDEDIARALVNKKVVSRMDQKAEKMFYGAGYETVLAWYGKGSDGDELKVLGRSIDLRKGGLGAKPSF